MPGKNEAKRAAAAALKDLDEGEELTDEQRERQERKGMGLEPNGRGQQLYEERLAAKEVAPKLSKEEKKAQTEARRAALAERKEQKAAMKAAIAANREALGQTSLGERGSNQSEASALSEEAEGSGAAEAGGGGEAGGAPYETVSSRYARLK